jgi:hypothetical protein
MSEFAVKYTFELEAKHLLTTLKKMYVCSTDWSGLRYCGLTLKWDYDARTCEVSMPGYIECSMQWFQHLPPSCPEMSPHHAWQKPTYGAKTQYARLPDTSNPLNAADTKHIQEVLGTLLYYACGIDSTMIIAISTLASQQTHGTKATMITLTQLLNYAVSNPEASILYTVSDMNMHVSSNVSYLSAPKACSSTSDITASAPSHPILPNHPSPRIRNCQTMAPFTSLLVLCV